MTNTSMIQITPIRAFQDNYIWCIQQEAQCAVVDPGDAEPVLEYLHQHQLELTDILITHHHADHIGGLRTLCNQFPNAKVYAANRERIPNVDRCLQQDDVFSLQGISMQCRVLEVPGHTSDHIAFYSAEEGLFCGDTLFSGGCGRLFEGTPTQMFESLQKLVALPANTKVYCAHEYTLANLTFASEVEPGNASLNEYYKHAKQIRADDNPTLPSTVEQELAINPFLRCDQPEICRNVSQHAGRKLADEKDTFAELRNWKDNF